MARKSRKIGSPARRASGWGAASAPRLSSAAAESITRRIMTLLNEQKVFARIIELVNDIFGPNALHEAWREFRCSKHGTDGERWSELAVDSPFLEQYASWLAHTWTPDELSRTPEGIVADHVPTRMFLARHPELDPLLARYLHACMETPFSFFEVLKCEGGRRFTCRNLIEGTRHTVFDGAMATALRPRQILYARIVAIDGMPIIDAAAPWALSEIMKAAILAQCKAVLADLSGHIDAAHARQRLLAHDRNLREFYWGFAEEALRGNLLRM